MLEAAIAAVITGLIGVTTTTAMAAARRAREARDFLMQLSGQLTALTTQISTNQDQLTQHMHESAAASRDIGTRLGCAEQRISSLEGSMERRRNS
jgi:hypothetical protein